VTLQGREWGDLPLKRGRSPGQQTCLAPLATIAPFRLPGLQMGCAGVLWGDPRQGRPFQRLHRRRACARGGVAGLVFFLLLLEGCIPWELASFHHHSASRIFITQPGCNLRPVVIRKDDYQPCGGENRAGLRPPPYPQLQGCSSSTLGRRASRVGASPSAWAGSPLLPPAFGGEGRSPALWRRRTMGSRGRPSVALSAAVCLAPRPRWL
jgi:hypothetical protein